MGIHDRFFLHWISQIEALMYLIAVICAALSVILVIAALMKFIAASQENSMMGRPLSEHLSVAAHEILGAVLLLSLTAIAIFGAGVVGLEPNGGADQFGYGVPETGSTAKTFILALSRLFAMVLAASFALGVRRAADKNGSGYKGPVLLLIFAGILFAPFESLEFVVSIFSPYPVNFGYTPGF